MRRVVITGIGVLAPGGRDTKGFWDLITGGRTATRRLTLFNPAGFRSQVSAECAFDPGEHGFSPGDVARLDRATLLLITATRDAIADSDIVAEALDPHRVGVSIGTAIGCTMSLEEDYVLVSDRGRRWLVDSGYRIPGLYGHFVPSSMAAEVACVMAAEGPVTTISTGCTSGIDAVGYAADLIREGSVDVMITGATDAPLSPITYACFDAIRATSSDNDEPQRAARPFDRTRNGFVLGEGSAVLVLEEAGHARGRGAHVYAEIAGFACRCNAYHMTGLRPDGREMADAITRAMHDARVNAEDIDYVNAHGSGTRQNDLHETAALKASLGRHAYATPVSSIKSMIGHSLGAIGSIEIAACALAIEHDIVAPTANLYEPDPACDLDYVPLVARDQRSRHVLTVGSEIGGFQSAMVLTRPGAST